MFHSMSVTLYMCTTAAGAQFTLGLLQTIYKTKSYLFIYYEIVHNVHIK